jgi:Protein of unknown function (DUF3575)
MKKVSLLLLLAMPIIANCQLGILSGKNIIKTNLSSLALQNYNLTYEHSLTKRISISASYRFMPKITVPLKELAKKYINDPSVNVEDFKMGNSAITLELRLYLGMGRMKGFYIAPYVRQATFDLDVPLSYKNPDYPTLNPSASFSGKFTSLSAGLMIGMQYQIAKKIVLDIWLLGGHYGTSEGKINAAEITPALTSSQAKDALQQKLNDLENIGPFKFKGTVTSSTTAEITTVGPWVGFRGAGLCLGIRF